MVSLPSIMTCDHLFDIQCEYSYSDRMLYPITFNCSLGDLVIN